MEKDELLRKYNEGLLTEKEHIELEEAIEAGIIELSELKTDSVWLDRLNYIKDVAPSEKLSERFYTMLSANSDAARARQISITLPSWWKVAASIAIFGLGALFGLLLEDDKEYKSEIAQISSELDEMKEVVMFTLLKEGSASDKLKAVSYTREIPRVSERIAGELLYTLNNDDNINVRLATVEALARYVAQPDVREGLINSITIQESPLVQMALLEVMVAIREKKAVNEFRELIKKGQVTQEVRNKVEKGINILI